MTTETQPIAVVGMALRVPQADTPEAFWNHVVAGRDCLSRESRETLRFQGVPESVLNDPRFVGARPMLRDIEYFDERLFGMSPFECERTDPVHRLFLECVWQALERAGVKTGADGPTIGVIAGVEGEYRSNLSRIGIPRDLSVGLPIRLGTETEFAAARASFKLDLTGPSFAVEAACATSLLAIHLAADSLRRGECDVAVAGGGTVLLPNEAGYLAGVEGMLSSSGRIHAFDERADGTVFGSGVGVVVLRPLAEAVAQGHAVHAVLLGSATNNDGCPESKESFIAPSPEGQKRAIAAALSRSGVGADTIGYVEAHGTATLLGDPIEVSSLAEVYRRDTASRNYCAIGSVKSNVGHLRNAAGVVSFIKACLALEHCTLPPAANFQRPNRLIDFDSSPFFVNTEPLTWTGGQHPRRAAVSSFGFGGSNAHAIVEEYRAPGSRDVRSERPVLLPVSACSPSARRRLLSDLATHVETKPEVGIENIAHTLRQRRRMPHSACLLLDQNTKVSETLAEVSERCGPENRPVIFLFPGQGAQRVGMGRQLYASEAVYRESVDQCAELLLPELDVDIRALLLLEPTQANPGSNRALRQTANAQPALFTVEYSLACLFHSWGLHAGSMLGHSIGELVAACLAGVMTLAEAIHLVAARARLMQQCEPGAMAAVFLSAEEMKAVLPAELDIAAINAPALTVVSGPVAAVESLIDELTRQGVGCRKLETSHAFHSRMMEPSLDEFRAIASNLELKAPRQAVISNLTGLPITPAQARDPGYWAEQVRRVVHFSDGVNYLLSDARPLFVELGPGTTLTDLVRHHDPDVEVSASLGGDSHTDGDTEQSKALLALGRLWCAGAKVDWNAFEGSQARQKVILPTYPFQRHRHWINRQESGAGRSLNLYQRFWEQSAAVPCHEAGNRAWLVFCDSRGLGKAIIDRLQSSGARVTTLTMGEAFARLGDDSYMIRPASQEDLSRVLASTTATGANTEYAILHLWTVTGPDGQHNNLEGFKHCSRVGFYTLLALVQAAHEHSIADALKILVVADGMLAAAGEGGPAYAEKSVVLGPCRTIPKEIPGLSMRGLDIPQFETGQAPQWLVDAVVAEVGANNQDSPAANLVVLRPGGRYEERFTKLSELAIGRPNLRHNGTVLITGGVGALGLLVAKSLYDTVNARLILTSRRRLPPRDAWQRKSQENTRMGRALRQLIELEQQGAEVLVVEVDLSDGQALEQALSQARKRFGDIHGIVHAAGVIDDGPALTKTESSAEKVFAGKVHGAFHLEELFAGTSLDFFIHFSSLASTSPSPGQVDYSAANAVLDALASRRAGRSRGLNCAVGWGPWLDVGLAARSAGIERDAPDIASESRTPAASKQLSTLDHPLIRERRRWSDSDSLYRGWVHPARHWPLDEHRLDSRSVMSGTTIIDCMYSAFADHTGERGIELSDVALLRPLFVDDGGAEIEIAISQVDEVHRITFRSRAKHGDQNWSVNAAGYAKQLPDSDRDPIDIRPFSQRDTIGPITSDTRNKERWYFGPHWKCVEVVEQTGDSTWVQLSLPVDCREDVDRYGVHPALLDQSLIQSTDRFYADSLPFHYDCIRIYRPMGPQCTVLGQRRSAARSETFDVTVADQGGRVAVEVVGFMKRELQGTAVGAESGAGSTTPEAFGGSFRLVVDRPGDLESIKFVSLKPVKPGPEEVQIDVVAVGLNFRDVLGAMGQLANIEQGELGLGVECSGIVKAVGRRVRNFRIGDPVLAIARPSLGSQVTVNVKTVRPVPRGMSFEEAAGIPTAFLTAAYALNHLARLGRGERVLIHAATGGVGLAAVQLARLAGAEIFATAGRASKRELLHELGIEHVMDSRSAEFAEIIREPTDGEGVDVVLNSLAGEFIPAGLELLRPMGRFVEIGKRDIYAGTPVSLKPFQRNLAYFSVDLAIVEKEQSEVFTELFDRTLEQFVSGELEPLPTTVIPAANASAGFLRMARAEHVGKVVFKVADIDVPVDDPAYQAATVFKFKQRFGGGIPVDLGVEAFRRILSSDEVPDCVIAVSHEMEASAGRVVAAAVDIDRTRPESGTPYRAPTCEKEKTLVSIWENTLGVSPVGVDDDFFDLGGDSLTAIQIQSVINKELGMNLPINIFLDMSTVAGVAEAMDNQFEAS